MSKRSKQPIQQMTVEQPQTRPQSLLNATVTFRNPDGPDVVLEWSAQSGEVSYKDRSIVVTNDLAFLHTIAKAIIAATSVAEVVH